MGVLEKVVLDARKENNNGIVATPSQAVLVCESSGTALVPLQDQKQDELWEEDSLDLDLDENNENKETEETEKSICLNNDLAGTLGKVVLDASKYNNIGIVATPSQDKPACETSKAAQQSELWEEDNLDLNLDENNEEKEKEEVENNDYENNSLTETLGSIVDTSKEKNTESLVLPVLDVRGCKTSGTALIPLQDQQQNELWEEDSLFLDSDENVEEKEKEEGDNSECLNNGISGTLGKIVVDANKEKNTEGLILPPLDVAVCEIVVVALRPFQNQEQNKSLEEDCLDLDLDENNKEKEKEEAENGDCENDNVAQVLESVDAGYMENTESLLSQTQDEPVCESLIEALIPMQDQEQHELWEDDSLDLALVENDEEKEKQEAKNGDCDIDVSKEKKNENFTPPTQYVQICDSLVAALIPMQDQEQNVLWEEDSLDLDLDENNEEKEKEEVENVFQSESLTGTLENVVDANNKKNIECLISPPPKNVLVCESSVVETTIMQDQKQNGLWEEDSLDLDLEKNNGGRVIEEVENGDRQNENLTQTLGNIVEPSKEKNTENLISPPQDGP